MRAAGPSARRWNSSMTSWHLSCSVTPQTRRIIHIDMDAFYASVESRDDPSLRGKPLAVGGSPQSRGVVMAASYEARALRGRSAIPIAPERVEQFLQQLPVETLWGVGPVTAKKLRAVGIARLVDVRGADRELLSRTVGSLGEWLIRLSHGDDPRPVISDRPYKSISCEETYARDLSDFQEMAGELKRMSVQLAASLSRKRLRARTVTIKVRYADFTTVTRSHTAESASNSEKYIADCARTLLARTDAASRPVRLLGVGAHGLEREGDGHPESERLF